MNEDMMVAYSIINRVCITKGFPMYKLMHINLFSRVEVSNVMTEIKSIAVHNIRRQTKLTHKQIALLFKLTSHCTSIYFSELYNDMYQTDKYFRMVADHALAS